MKLKSGLYILFGFLLLAHFPNPVSLANPSTKNNYFSRFLQTLSTQLLLTDLSHYYSNDQAGAESLCLLEGDCVKEIKINICDIHGVVQFSEHNHTFLYGLSPSLDWESDNKIDDDFWSMLNGVTGEVRDENRFADEYSFYDNSTYYFDGKTERVCQSIQYAVNQQQASDLKDYIQLQITQFDEHSQYYNLANSNCMTFAQNAYLASGQNGHFLQHQDPHSPVQFFSLYEGTSENEPPQLNAGVVYANIASQGLLGTVVNILHQIFFQ